MTAHPHQLTEIEDRRVRLQLMLTYDDLATAGLIRRSLPPEAWDDLIRGADADDRPWLVTVVLAAQQADHQFRPCLAEELIALAIYEASESERDELVFLVDWSPLVTQAIAEVSRAGRLEIPVDLLTQTSWRRSNPHGRRAVETTPAMILAEHDRDARAELVDAYQSLWAWDIIDEALDGDILGETFEHLESIGEEDWAERLRQLVPAPAVARAATSGSYDLSGRTTRPLITASYAAVPAAARWRPRTRRARLSA